MVYDDNSLSIGRTPLVRLNHVVDGAHAPAVIPLQVDDLDCDFYAGNGHKWLLAPIGTGFLVLGKNSLDDMTLATPAVLRGSIVLRTQTKLYRIGK